MDSKFKTQLTGDYCELLALTRLVREGYTVTMPYGVQPGWDFLVNVNGNWEKWQIKTARRLKPHFKSVVGYVRKIHKQYEGKNRSVPYKQGEFDKLLIVEPNTGWMWIIPFEHLQGKVCISVRDKSEFRWWNKEPSKFFLT